MKRYLIAVHVRIVVHRGSLRPARVERVSPRPRPAASGRRGRAASRNGPGPARQSCKRHRVDGYRCRSIRSRAGWRGPDRDPRTRIARGPSGRRGGIFGSSGAAARSAVVMNGLSAALRQAMNRSCAPCAPPPQVRKGLNRIGEEHHAEARHDHVEAAGLEHVNPARRRRMNSAGVRSCSARARASAIIGSEMSMPRQRPVASSARATASVVLPVPQPTSSTKRGRRCGHGIDEQILEWGEESIEHLLRIHPGASCRAVPQRCLLARGVVCGVHRAVSPGAAPQGIRSPATGVTDPAHVRSREAH